MDRDIYGKIFSRNDYGVYATRRYPKGTGSPTIPNGPTQPTDPNANPVVIVRQYSGAAVVPHAAATRWTYTVPPKRRAALQVAQVEVTRDTAAATPNGSLSLIYAIRAGTDGTTVAIVQAHMKNGALGTRISELHPGPLEFFEGDQIKAVTFDVSLDGTLTYLAALQLIEYDNQHPPVGADYHSVTGVSASQPSGSSGLFGGGNTGGQWKYPTAAVMTRDRGGSSGEIAIAGSTGIVPRRLMTPG